MVSKSRNHRGSFLVLGWETHFLTRSLLVSTETDCGSTLIVSKTRNGHGLTSSEYQVLRHSRREIAMRVSWVPRWTRRFFDLRFVFTAISWCSLLDFGTNQSPRLLFRRGYRDGNASWKCKNISHKRFDHLRLKPTGAYDCFLPWEIKGFWEGGLFTSGQEKAHDDSL